MYIVLWCGVKGILGRENSFSKDVELQELRFEKGLQGQGAGDNTVNCFLSTYSFLDIILHSLHLFLTTVF